MATRKKTTNTTKTTTRRTLTPTSTPEQPAIHPKLLVAVEDAPGYTAAAVIDLALATINVGESMQKSAEELTIKTEANYITADHLLSVVTNAHQNDEGLVSLESIIRPIRKGLDILYAINRRIDKPYSDAIDTIKHKMAEYKTAERRRLEAEQRKRDEEARQAAAEVAKRNANKPSPAPALEPISTPVVAAMPLPSSMPVKTANSSDRAILKVRVTNLEDLILAVAADMAPESCLLVNESALRNWLKLDENAVRNCPGLEVYEDTQIIRK